MSYERGPEYRANQGMTFLGFGGGVLAFVLAIIAMIMLICCGGGTLLLLADIGKGQSQTAGQ